MGEAAWRVPQYGMTSSDEPSATADRPRLLGWREWVGLPDLGLPGIKAKLDTGARTSALHAFDIHEVEAEDGTALVEFSTRPLQRNDQLVVRCRAPLIEQRRVTDSGGHRADRYVVRTDLVLGELRRSIELTLTDRADMLFRMLVGRTALAPDQAVDPAASFALGRQKPRELYTLDPAS